MEYVALLIAHCIRSLRALDSMYKKFLYENRWLATSESLVSYKDESSGPERTRTACLLIANEALYQVSYGPVCYSFSDTDNRVTLFL